MYFFCDGEVINNLLSDIFVYLNNVVKYKIIEKIFFFYVLFIMYNKKILILVN